MPSSFPSPQSASPKLVELLRSTLKRLEDSPGVEPGDPKVVEFKNSILRAITELEVQRANAA